MVITKAKYKKPKYYEPKKTKYDSYGSNSSSYYEPNYNAKYESDYKTGDYKLPEITYAGDAKNANYGDKKGAYGEQYSSSEISKTKYAPSKHSSQSKKTRSRAKDEEDDHEFSASDPKPSVYPGFSTYDGYQHDYQEYPAENIEHYGKKRKKTYKTTSYIAPMSEYDSPTNYYPYDADEGEEVEHLAYSTDDGKSKDLNPKNILKTLLKMFTKEKINLKVNIDYNKDKTKHEKKKPEQERNRSIGKMIDEHIKKLEDEEYRHH
ncbi:hypothetical protein NH340_JMT06818 [Sarcoptes scabiei]|nr:hypothetical protein NH340_JMT06818 [Sarcoptes scabiei]